jgi:hypothetical protein
VNYTVYVIVEDEDEDDNVSAVASVIFLTLKSSPSPDSGILLANYSFDTVWILDTKFNNTFRVYDSATGGNLLGSATAQSSDPLCINLNKQLIDLVSEEDTVYVSLQESGRVESNRTAVTAGPTRIISNSQSWDKNENPYLFKLTITYNGELSYESYKAEDFMLYRVDGTGESCTVVQRDVTPPADNQISLYFSDVTAWSSCTLEYETGGSLKDTTGNSVQSPESLSFNITAPN